MIAKRTTRLRPEATVALLIWLLSTDRVREVTIDGHTVYDPTAVTFEGAGFVTTEYEVQT